MTEKNPNWGGKRPNAGRPRKGIAKAPKPPTPKQISQLADKVLETIGPPLGASTQKPIVKAKVSKEEQAKKRLGFKDLENRVGIRVLDKAMHMPVQRRMIQVGNRYYPEAGPILHGQGRGFRGAKVPYTGWDRVDPDAFSYGGMHKYYREFRRDSLVRSSITALGFYSTNKGFETELEPAQEMDPDAAKLFVDRPEFQAVKKEIDEANRNVNLDQALNIAVINKKIYGCAAFEKVRESRISAGYVRHVLGQVRKYKGQLRLGQLRKRVIRLLPLDSTRILPHHDPDWNLMGYDYAGQENFYSPDEVLYFPNLALGGDMVGLSSIEPVMDALLTRRTILEQALPEAATVLWTGTGYVQVDTQGLLDADAEAAITSVEEAWTPGRFNFGNHKVTATIVDLNPDLQKLIGVMEYLDQEIIGNFQVPRFIIGREKQFNRATAYAELETFVNGPIAQEQRDLRRVIEADWYEPLVREILGIPQSQDPLIRLKHKWKPISTADFTELLTALSNAAGPGWLPGQKAYELAGFDVKELEKRYMPVQVEKKKPPPTVEQNPETLETNPTVKEEKPLAPSAR